MGHAPRLLALELAASLMRLRASLAQCRTGLVVSLLIVGSSADAQNRNPVYPRGAAILYRNIDAPFRYARNGGSTQFRANINFEGERIEIALLIWGTDGKFYSNAHSSFRQRDGWILAVATGIYLDDLQRLDSIRTERWSRLQTQTDLDIDWYLLDRTEVDRERAQTPRISPYPPGFRDTEGRSFIRYYLARVSLAGTGWSITRTPPARKGSIIAPMVCIRWEERKDGRTFVRFLWLPRSLAPLPGMNDCLGLRSDGSGTCQGELSEPLRRVGFNQYYDTTRYAPAWTYSESIGYRVYWYPFSPYIGYPVQYPIFVFRNLGSETRGGGHSMLGLHSESPRYSIPYDSPRWWLVHRATVYQDVPYEWGGKYYAAQTSGRLFSYAPNGTNNGFGLDCSGLIAVALGFYNETRYGTGRIMESTVPISWDRVIPGDVIIKEGTDPHVLLVIKVMPNNDIANVGNGGVTYRYVCLEAKGANANQSIEELPNVERVREYGGSKSVFESQGFSPRRFRHMQ